MKARETNPGTESALSLMVDEAPPSAPLLDKLDWLLTVERPLNTPYLDALLLGQWGQGMVVSGDRVYIVNPHTGLYHSLRLRRNAESDDALFWLRETLAKARDKANGRRGFGGFGSIGMAGSGSPPPGGYRLGNAGGLRHAEGLSRRQSRSAE